MPTTTWSTMRQEIVRPFGLVTGTVSTNLSASNASIIDTDLIRKYPSNDLFNNNWFVIITSLNSATQVRRITDYVGSSGTLTAAGANWESGDGSGAT